MSRPRGVFGVSSAVASFLTPKRPNTFGSIHTVSPALFRAGPAYPLTGWFTDPVFYIPLKSIERGPGKLSKDGPSGEGYWIGSLAVDQRKTRLVCFEGGELDGLVKITAGYLGKCCHDWQLVSLCLY